MFRLSSSLAIAQRWLAPNIGFAINERSHSSGFSKPNSRFAKTASSSTAISDAELDAVGVYDDKSMKKKGGASVEKAAAT